MKYLTTTGGTGEAIAVYVMFECDANGVYLQGGKCHIHEWKSMKQLSLFYQDVVRHSSPGQDKLWLTLSSISRRYGNAIIQHEGGGYTGVQCVISEFMGCTENKQGLDYFRKVFSRWVHGPAIYAIDSRTRYTHRTLEQLNNGRYDDTDYQTVGDDTDDNTLKLNTLQPVVDLDNSSKPSENTINEYLTCNVLTRMIEPDNTQESSGTTEEMIYIPNIVSL